MDHRTLLRGRGETNAVQSELLKGKTVEERGGRNVPSPEGKTKKGGSGAISSACLIRKRLKGASEEQTKGKVQEG